MGNWCDPVITDTVLFGVWIEINEIELVYVWLRIGVNAFFSHLAINNRSILNLLHNFQILFIMQSKRMNQNAHNLKTKNQNLSFLNKENIVDKHDRKIKISFVDLTPYLHQQFGFIDPDFPHVYTSINENQNPPMEGVQWLKAEELHENSNYSDLITNLQTNLFHRKSISHALIIINWFANTIFTDIFMNQLSNDHLYEFDVMIDGLFVHMPIDSYVPINSNNKKQIFTQNYKGSIFPCLYEKLLAKIYGDYQSITSQFIDIVQLQTFFCRQEVSLTGEIKQKQILSIMEEKLEQKSILCFRTRNSIRLQSFGLQSNYVYIILRVLKRQQEFLVQFLQLDGQSWIGKHSKLRSSWLLQEEYIQQKQIIRNEEYKQNYMSLRDMKGIGRQLIILNNTLQYHKNYYASNNSQAYFNLYKLIFTQTNKGIIRINFKHKKCYSSLYIIEKTGLSYKLIKSVFRQNKQSLYAELTLNPGEYYAIVYNTHSQQQILPYNFTLFTSSQFVEIVPINSANDTLNIIEKAFLAYFSQKYRSTKETILFKQLYNMTGLAFIYINAHSSSLSVKFNNAMMEQRKIFCVNLKPVEDEINIAYENKQAIIIFRCLWSRKENIDFQHENINSKQEIQKIVFPPIGSIKVYHKIKK